MKMKNNGSERKEQNFMVEAAQYWRNCVIGEKIKNDDGTSNTIRDSKKNYKKSKVILGTIVGGLAAVATGAGAAIGIEKLKNRNDNSDLELIDMGDVEVIDLPEEGTETTNE